MMLILALTACGGSETAPLNPVPQIGSLSPDSATQAPRTLQLTINGADFVQGAQVLWNGAPRVTSFVSSSVLTAQVLESDLNVAGTASVSVRNPTPGGGSSATLPFEVWGLSTPVPALTALAPDRVPFGAGAQTIRVTGTGFVPASKVQINSIVVATTFVSVTALDAQLADSLLTSVRVLKVSVYNRPPAGGTTKTLDLAVENPKPELASLSTATLPAGQSGASISVDGRNFVPGAVIRFNGASRATTRVSATHLSAQLLAGDLRDPGTFEISVANPAPGGGASGSLPLTIVAVLPSITTLPSSSAIVGRPNTKIAVDGTGFVAGTVVTVNGQDRTTTYGAWNRLSFILTGTDVASPGVLAIAVRTPGVTGSSSSVPFTIRNAPAPTISAITTVPGWALDLMYDAGTARLYAGMRDGPNRDRLVVIDPLTGQVTNSVPAMVRGRLDVTSDRQYMYVVVQPVSPLPGMVRRLAFPSLTTLADLPIKTDARDMQLVPGSPLSMIISSFYDVHLYENGVLQNTTPPDSWIDVTLMAPGPTPGTIFSETSTTEPSLRLIGFGSSARALGAMSNAPSGAAFDYAAGRFYSSGTSSNGEHAAMTDFDLSTVVGRFPGGGVQMLVEPALGRALLLDGPTLTAYDLNTFERLGAVTVFPSIPLALSLSHGKIVRWASDGLAIRDDNNVYIFRTGLAAP